MAVVALFDLRVECVVCTEIFNRVDDAALGVARIAVMRALNRHVERASFGLGATALNYLEVPSPIRRHLSRNSKRGIHNPGSGH